LYRCRYFDDIDLAQKSQVPDCGSKIELEHVTEGGTVLTCKKGHKYVELD